MTDEDRRRMAQAVLEHPLLMEFFNAMEQNAVSACLNTKSSDHETRLAYAVEARTIRNLLSRIRTLSQDNPEPVSRRAPA